MNGSVQQLAYSILEYRRYAERVREIADENRQIAIAESFRSRLSMLDSTIDDDADSWWRLVTDQAVDGLL